MSDCIFCRIVAGQAPASLVYRDEGVCAFMDLQPVNAGHVLVVPVAHATSLSELPPTTAGGLMQVGQQVALALHASSLPCEGVCLYLADGVAAGQDVMHVHLHVFPRYGGDGFGLRLPTTYGRPVARAELERVAALIRQALPSAIGRDHAQA